MLPIRLGVWSPNDFARSVLHYSFKKGFNHGIVATIAFSAHRYFKTAIELAVLLVG